MPSSPQGGPTPTPHDDAIEAVGAVLLDARRRVLLVLRARMPGAGTWSLPGGRVEPGESAHGAVLREVLEETGLPARIVADLGVVLVEGDGVWYAIRELLLVPSARAEDARAGDDAADLRWVPFEDLSQFSVTPAVSDVVALGVAAFEKLLA